MQADSPNRKILGIAIPSIATALSTPLMGTVDTALMGFVSKLHLGAIGLSSQIFDIVYWSFGFLRMATTGLTGQALGQKDAVRVASILWRNLLLATLLGLVIIALQAPILDVGIWLLGATPAHAELISTYVSIRVWSAPATLGVYVLTGWFLGLERARIPLLLTILGNGLNIGISVWLVAYRDQGVAGVAWGTLIAEYITLGAALVIAFISQHSRGAQLKHLFDLRQLGEQLVLQRDIFLRTLALNVVFAVFNNRAASLGATALAANVIIMKMMGWISYAVDGFALAAEALVAQTVGAQAPQKQSRIIRLCFTWGFALAAVFSLVFLLGAPTFGTWFTSDQSVLEYASNYWLWLALLPWLGAASYLWDGVFIGLTAGRDMRNSMGFALLVFAATVLPLIEVLGNHGLWLAFSLFLLARAAAQWLMYRRKWRSAANRPN